jgi:hypothetical protein
MGESVFINIESGSLAGLAELEQAGYKIHFFASRPQLKNRGFAEQIDTIRPKTDTFLDNKLLIELARRIKPGAAFETSLPHSKALAQIGVQVFYIGTPGKLPRGKQPSEGIIKVTSFKSGVRLFLAGK